MINKYLQGMWYCAFFIFFFMVVIFIVPQEMKPIAFGFQVLTLVPFLYCNRKFREMVKVERKKLHEEIIKSERNLMGNKIVKKQKSKGGKKQ